MTIIVLSIQISHNVYYIVPVHLKLLEREREREGERRCESGGEESRMAVYAIMYLRHLNYWFVSGTHSFLRTASLNNFRR